MIDSILLLVYLKTVSNPAKAEPPTRTCPFELISGHWPPARSIQLTARDLDRFLLVMTQYDRLGVEQITVLISGENEDQRTHAM